jgi:Tetrahydrofolate dehydrogenase/cyclohydrolase, NAD(P)-binding domain
MRIRACTESCYSTRFQVTSTSDDVLTKSLQDVDGVTVQGFGQMAMKELAYGSATPAGIMPLLEHYQVALSGKHAVVIGRSPILGKPISMMLLNANATVTVCHSHTRELPKIVGLADVVVGALGKPQFIQGRGGYPPDPRMLEKLEKYVAQGHGGLDELPLAALGTISPQIRACSDTEWTNKRQFSSGMRHRQHAERTQADGVSALDHTADRD